MRILKIGRSAALSLAFGLTTAASVSALEAASIGSESGPCGKLELVGNNIRCFVTTDSLVGDLNLNDAGETQVSGISKASTSGRAKSSRGHTSKASLCCRRAVYSVPVVTQYVQPQVVPQPLAAFPQQPAFTPQPFGPSPYAPSPYGPSPYAPSPYPQPPYGPSPYAPQPYTPATYSPPGYPGPGPYNPPPVNNLPTPAPTPGPSSYANSQAQPGPASPAGDVVLNNVENVPISYTLNGARHDLNSGYKQRHTDRGSLTIEFHRGAGHGTARYTLPPGSYHFVGSEKGWDLIRKDDRISAPTPIPGFQSVNRR